MVSGKDSECGSIFSTLLLAKLVSS